MEKQEPQEEQNAREGIDRSPIENQHGEIRRRYGGLRMDEENRTLLVKAYGIREMTASALPIADRRQ